ncbi:MAG: hypothetical protein ACQESV_04350 [Thermodesulfobacteriota bacterium]
MDGLYTAQAAPQARARQTKPAPQQKQASGTFSTQLAAAKTAQTTSNAQASGAENIALGRLGSDAPTVSHLLVQNEATRNNVWEIVHNQANATKDFQHIPAGETIYLNPKTQEITWGSGSEEEKSTKAATSAPDPAAETAQDPPTDKQPATVASNTEPPNSSNHGAADVSSLFRTAGAEAFLNSAFDFSAPYAAAQAQNATPSLPELNQAVAAYCGNSYNQMDCFELVVQGLKDMGVDYGGREGLQRSLIAKAEQEGQPSNAYLTGEGLINASGRHVFQSAFHPPEDPQAKAEALFAELSGNLEPGMVLSFSTPNRGHTGVVGKQGEDWTFINSGLVNNPVGPSSTDYGVAEEDLRAELATWLQRSATNGETLQVSLGALDPNKLAQFRTSQVDDNV